MTEEAPAAAYHVAADHVVTDDVEGMRVYVAAMPGGPISLLHGSAAVIWWEATSGPAQGWVGRVAEAFEQPEEVIGDDVQAFVASLQERGLLDQSGPAGAPVDDGGTPPG